MMDVSCNILLKRGREILHLFQPPRADQMPNSKEGQLCIDQTSKQSLMNLATLCRLSCQIKWTVVLACAPNNAGYL
jgi:hypothetical protein